MAGSQAPICPYCDSPSKLVGGDVIYPHRPDLSGKKFYHCDPCGAWVGCHPKSTRALGRLANVVLREAKRQAHAAFDPLWKAKIKRHGVPKWEARGAGYAWLAKQLGISADDCHIGMMDEAMCRRVIEVCTPFRRAA